MECRETQTFLTAFHDGELADVDRARVEEHLRGCRECGALLAGLARADRAAGVPDPGPAYWDRFNARVMDRVEREADGPNVAVLRPKRGWMRQQLRYLVPAAAAAALVVVVVRYGGMHPGVSTTARDGLVPGQAEMPRGLSPRPPALPPALSEPAPPVSAGQRIAKAEPETRATKKAESGAAARRVPEESGRVVERPPPPPVAAGERFAAVTREERDGLADRPRPAGNEEASRERAAAPAAVGALSPPPMTYRRAPDGQGLPGAAAGGDAKDSGAPAAGSPPVASMDGMAGTVQGEQKKMAGTAAPTAERHVAGKAESASGMRMAKEGPSPLASAPSPAASPCELARTLAAQERWREAEAAQRACLAQDRSAPAQEKGLVFLAELLDRQVRFAEADKVITEVEQQFPRSRPLDLYRQQRPMVQKRQIPVPAAR